ncbi:MAG: M28 family peptidase [Oceanihabitans sp.]
MRAILFTVLCYFALCTNVTGQTITDVINAVSLDSLKLNLKEFSGEQPTIVNGNTVTILNRVESNNDLAADYLLEKLNSYNNLTVVDQLIDGQAGRRNIIATQLGKTNPDAIYMICAHYDSTYDYCADDNASGTAAVLEIARILSTQCLDNTIVYALWDEEEIGLIGSRYYANQAAANNKNILGVLNIDMMGYDGNDDNKFDIDVRDVANSLGMKNDIISILNNPEYGFTLDVVVVNPGTTASDHSRFWSKGYSAVLVGESWETNDQTPFYHNPADKYNTLNFPYYHELTKLIMGYMVTKAGLVEVDNTITQNANLFTANQNEAEYQWIDCETNTAIPGATNQSFIPTENGNYAVEVTIGTCTEKSDCVLYNSLSVDEFNSNEFTIYPNPVKSHLVIEIANNSEKAAIELLDVTGKIILKKTTSTSKTTLNLSALNSGVYFLKVLTNNKYKVSKIVKE